MEPANNITTHNYEAFMVDYWDGNLSPQDESQLLRFLDEHPEIKQDMQDAAAFTLPEDKLEFENKELLFKQEVSPKNIDEFLVAELEQDLLPHQANELHLFIAANPQYKKDRALFALTKIAPDKNLVYPNKRNLKKGLMQPLWIQYSSVAAAACMFILFGLWWKNRTEITNGNLAHEQKVVPQKEIPITSIQEQKPALPELVKQQSNPIFRNAARHNSIDLIPEPENTSELVIAPAVESENFYSYSKNRKADDYLDGLINNYLPDDVEILANNASPIDLPLALNNEPQEEQAGIINNIASKSLKKMIKDSALAVDLENQKFSVKTKLAKAAAWATSKVSGGKVSAVAIPNSDGSLAAMSFTNGKYNYTKRF